MITAPHLLCRAQDEAIVAQHAVAAMQGRQRTDRFQRSAQFGKPQRAVANPVGRTRLQRTPRGEQALPAFGKAAARMLTAQSLRQAAAGLPAAQQGTPGGAAQTLLQGVESLALSLQTGQWLLSMQSRLQLVEPL